MSKSVLLKSSLAKKYWMALTGLFLCLFLVGHLAGNLQLLKAGEEGRRAFNEYAYFMAHNPMVKLLSYLTYISIIFHVIDGFLLFAQNRKARPVKYAHTRPQENSSFASRNMALLGTLILVFIVTHMQNFWYKAKISNGPFPLHTLVKEIDNQEYDPATGTIVNKKQDVKLYLLTNGQYQMIDLDDKDNIELRNNTEIYSKKLDVKVAEGYKDLYSLTTAFFGHDNSKYGFPKNDLATVAVIFYVVSMLVLIFHLWHGFSSAFQSLGLRSKKYAPIIITVGKIFAVVVPVLFAVIPVYLYLTK